MDVLPRVVVGVSGSSGSLTALHRAAAEARRIGASLWPVLAWLPPGGDSPYTRTPLPKPLRMEYEQMARERLRCALTEAFGPLMRPADLYLRGLIARGESGPALVAVADGEQDTLVVGTGRRSVLHRALHRSTARYCLAHARCPVLAVPPSPLEAELDALRRRTAHRLPLPH
ncbi:hypothetical protein BIV57_18875 [Mangrovactinospora gilvigrisea]|uniref:UspA domain-containing protein n=1 Tax=Mangrovactinospora gilvigrisea TaxID=1428644 RepID=A0A1J7BBE9_9ACTN|nr:hypothetical protein BIV57_18875 [Mangrovactinospora gilvigrisea]